MFSDGTDPRKWDEITLRRITLVTLLVGTGARLATLADATLGCLKPKFMEAVHGEKLGLMYWTCVIDLRFPPTKTVQSSVPWVHNQTFEWNTCAYMYVCACVHLPVCHVLCIKGYNRASRKLFLAVLTYQHWIDHRYLSHTISKNQPQTLCFPPNPY